MNKKRTQFMKNAYCEDGGVQLDGSQIVSVPSSRPSGIYIDSKAQMGRSHYERRIDDGCTKSTVEWFPRDARRLRGRPPTRWGDMFATRMDQLRA
ncbi:hypothetical protein RB195_007004 [Necator americanus]|uniref:Uncharacterized protein n=1 Tax=Necator americanus TaxID=51031 RepID=A0ABR1BV65_NECAM